MALHAVAITKETRWHGLLEEFSNIYYYDGPTFQAGDANYQRLVNRIADAEKAVHGDNVTFKVGRIWSAGGTVIENVTLGLYDLTGVGAVAGGQAFKEAAVLVEWECERPNVLGRKVYLRKYIRPSKLEGTTGTATYSGDAMLTAATKSLFKTYADKVQRPDDLTSGILWKLISPTGRNARADGNGVVNDYLVSREFRRN